MGLGAEHIHQGGRESRASSNHSTGYKRRYTSLHGKVTVRSSREDERIRSSVEGRPPLPPPSPPPSTFHSPFPPSFSNSTSALSFSCATSSFSWTSQSFVEALDAVVLCSKEHPQLTVLVFTCSIISLPLLFFLLFLSFFSTASISESGTQQLTAVATDHSALFLSFYCIEALTAAPQLHFGFSQFFFFCFIIYSSN